MISIFENSFAIQSNIISFAPSAEPSVMSSDINDDINQNHKNGLIDGNTEGNDDHNGDDNVENDDENNVKNTENQTSKSEDYFLKTIPSPTRDDTDPNNNNTEESEKIRKIGKNKNNEKNVFGNEIFYKSFYSTKKNEKQPDEENGMSKCECENRTFNMCYCRPDLQKIFGDVRTLCGVLNVRRVGVIVCGPLGLVDGVSSLCEGHSGGPCACGPSCCCGCQSEEENVKFDVHVETFDL